MELERQVMRQLAWHGGMGAVLGSGFAAMLLMTNSHRLLDLLLRSEAPALLVALFVIGLAVYFAFGSAITAFLFIASEEA